MRIEARTAGIAPGPFLRGTIVTAAIATAIVVASATIDSGRGHWAAALVALPLLVAAVIIAWIAYPRLIAATATALGLMLAAAYGLRAARAWYESPDANPRNRRPRQGRRGRDRRPDRGRP
jgi:uncharacterized membrane protein YfcA